MSEGCRLCGHPDRRPVGSFNGSRVVTCAACWHGAVDPLVGATVHEAAVEPGSLDLVTFWDVLEHVADRSPTCAGRASCCARAAWSG